MVLSFLLQCVMLILFDLAEARNYLTEGAEKEDTKEKSFNQGYDG